MPLRGCIMNINWVRHDGVQAVEIPNISRPYFAEMQVLKRTSLADSYSFVSSISIGTRCQI